MSLKSLIPIGRNWSRRDINPFNSLRQEVDRLFDDFAKDFRRFGSTALLPIIDVTETDKEIELTAELPSLEEKDVEVNIADNVLTIRGEKKVEKEQGYKNYRLLERSYGSFSRSIELPAGIDQNSIKTTLSKGVLKVLVQKPAPAVTKKVDIKATA